MKTRNAELLLGSLIVARASALLFSKLSMRSMGPFTLIGFRFSLAFLIMFLLFGKRFHGVKPATLLRGLALGLSFFAVMSCELVSLKITDSSSSTSFLENTAVVWVPLMEAIRQRRAPGRQTLLSAGLTLLGVVLLTLGGASFHLGMGEALCIAASFIYAWAILLTAKLSREDDALILGILQVGFLGLFGWIAALLLETPRLPQTSGQWGAILYLAVVCSCFGFTLQPVAQRYVSADRAGLFCALNPLTAAILGTLFLHESMTGRGILGAFLILGGILLRGLPEKRRKPVFRPTLQKTRAE